MTDLYDISANPKARARKYKTCWLQCYSDGSPVEHCAGTDGAGREMRIFSRKKRCRNKSVRFAPQSNQSKSHGEKMTKPDPIKSLELLVESRVKATHDTWESYWRKNENDEADCGIVCISGTKQGYSVCRAPRYQTEEQWKSDGDFIAQAANFAATEAPRLLAIIRRQRWALAKAAACMLKDNNGITDTVWLTDGTTLYEHLVGELDIEVTGDAEKDIAALEEYAALNDEGETNV